MKVLSGPKKEIGNIAAANSPVQKQGGANFSFYDSSRVQDKHAVLSRRIRQHAIQQNSKANFLPRLTKSALQSTQLNKIKDRKHVSPATVIQPKLIIQGETYEGVPLDWNVDGGLEDLLWSWIHDGAEHTFPDEVSAIVAAQRFEEAIDAVEITREADLIVSLLRKWDLSAEKVREVLDDELMEVNFGNILSKAHRFGKTEADVHSLDLISDTQAKGLAAIGNHILKRYNPDDFLYIGIGRSPVLVIEYLEQNGGKVVELPIGKIRHLESEEQENPGEHVQNYVRRIVGEIEKPNILLIDFAGSGDSLRFVKRVLEIVYSEKTRHIINFSLARSELSDEMSGHVRGEEMSNADSFSERMRPEIGKAIHAAFESVDVRTIDGETQPQPEAEAKARRAALVAKINILYG